MDLIDESGSPINVFQGSVAAGATESRGIIGANAFSCRITVDGPASDIRAEELLADCPPTDPQIPCTLATAAVAIAY